LRDPIKQGPDLDLVLRQSYIGSSEWAVVAGLFNKYKSLYDVWYEKINGYEPIDSLRMRHGRDAEPMIAKWVEEDMNVTVAKDGFVRFHQDYDFLATNLDGIIYHTDGSTSVLEIKTASTIARDTWGAELPIQYYVQIQGQMLVTGMKKAYVAIETFGFAGPEKFEILGPYDFDPEFAEMVVNKCVDFWMNHVVTQVAPEPMNDSDIKRVYPESNGHSLEASPELKTQIETLKQFKETKKEIDLSIKDLEIGIKKIMGDDEILTYGDDTLVTWKNGKPRESFDRKALEQDDAQLYEKYIKRSGPIRIFRVK